MKHAVYIGMEKTVFLASHLHEESEFPHTSLKGTLATCVVKKSIKSRLEAQKFELLVITNSTN